MDLPCGADMKNSCRSGLPLFLVLVACAVGQEGDVRTPCEYSGGLLRRDDGQVARFESDDMKKRATRKMDISGFLKQVDIKGTAVIDVLVGPTGEVVCAKTLLGHPIIRAEVEKAVRAWRFKPETVSAKPVAYLGRLEFYLCNISCGEQGVSMTLLK